MSTLKELTWEIHQQAERTSFARKLLKGLSPEEYHRYLYNQYMIYSILEELAEKLLPELKDIFRSSYIYEDLRELEKEYALGTPPDILLPVVRNYERYVMNLDRAGILAHIYVRHFGDMYGGQMIKKRNPGSGKMYEFNNVEELKKQVRSMLSDDMADEAKKCFEFAIQLFKELDNE
jgi:heme oxygenase (biliverdin-producing, ferredoxin)